ncbi:MAG: hypothetical protein NZR01_13890 [Bryobacteraceae bacterium]|nr:hypothetical protein [Bryobacteraceae bacterium]
MSPRRLVSAFLLLSLLPALRAQQEMVRRHRPMPAAGPYLVLKADLHMHTVFSDGQVWPITRVMEAWREDLDVIAITDHDDYRPNEKDVSMDLSRPYEIARPVAEGLGIVIIPGVEITKGDIHFNALFVRDHNAFRGKELISALTEAKKQGAFTFWNHPGWKGRAEWWPVIATACSDRLFQGIELLNGPVYYEEARPWIGQYGLTVMGNSDIHNASLPEDPRTVNLVLARERSVEGVREALHAGRTMAWDGARRLIGRREWLELLARSYLQAPGEVRFTPGFWYNGLPLGNRSALSFELRPVDAPAWMEVLPTVVPPRTTTVLQIRLRPDAPKQPSRVTLRLELSNTTVAETGAPLVLPFEFTLNP